jgi:hypothetical protein
VLGDLASDFDFGQTPLPPMLLPVQPHTTLTGTGAHGPAAKDPDD